MSQPLWFNFRYFNALNSLLTSKVLLLLVSASKFQRRYNFLCKTWLPIKFELDAFLLNPIIAPSLSLLPVFNNLTSNSLRADINLSYWISRILHNAVIVWELTTILLNEYTYESLFPSWEFLSLLHGSWLLCLWLTASIALFQIISFLENFSCALLFINTLMIYFRIHCSIKNVTC